MNFIKRFLIRSSIVDISKEDVLFLARLNDVQSLILFSSQGSARSRREALQGFNRLGFLNAQTKSHLFSLMVDKSLSVASLAKEILESRLMPSEIDTNPDYIRGNKAINEKLKYLEERIQYFKETSGSSNTLMSSRSDMKRLNQNVSPPQYRQPFT